MTALRQLALLSENLPPATTETEAGDHGEVFTREWVVELILDLCGYTEDHDLAAMVAVEPACGSGAFLLPMVRRLAASASRHGRPLNQAVRAIHAVDLLPANVAASRDAVATELTQVGMVREEASALAEAWVSRDDFLLRPPDDESVDFVLGNPPYIRLEAVPRSRSEAYRRACPTMGGRADVYVGFYEHGLCALRPGGTLGFICADRWMRNAYGAKLRDLVSQGWSMEAIVSMTGVDAFEQEVDAYPAITVMRRGPQVAGPLVISTDPDFGADDAQEITAHAAGRSTQTVRRSRYHAARLPAWFSGRGGWPHGSPDRLAVLADVESRLPPLEDPRTATRVGIGVATGADRVFLVTDPDVVEADRLLRLALPKDIATGTVAWSGKYLVNPWTADGLVDLQQWPRAAAYLGAHRDHLARRHTARGGKWHKTIDRVIEGLASREKLYVPDFKDVLFPVLDEGTTYPHHNLYWITSDVWDLRVLGGLLMSDVANMFISAYSVRMRGGYLRFQAQYLRRIRIPEFTAIDAASADALVSAFAARDRAAATEVALRLYGLDAVPE